jgi:septum formation protein
VSDQRPLILASASPRRRELLGFLGIPFEVDPASVDELLPEIAVAPASLARDLALAKAREIATKYPEAFVLGADTIVVLDNRILGKPEDAAEARSTLSALRGRSHQVITAIALLDPTGEWLDHTQTDVHMRDYNDAEIEAYIKSGEPFDKAGSYAIQDPIFQPVERCRGCYCNVVGLPILAVRSLLARADFRLPEFQRQALPYECHQCPLLNQIHD